MEIKDKDLLLQFMVMAQSSAHWTPVGRGGVRVTIDNDTLGLVDVYVVARTESHPTPFGVFKARRNR